MKMVVHLSGTTLFTGTIDGIPPVGTRIRIAMQTYKKGYEAGTVIDFAITAEQPVELDYTENPPVMYLDANGFTEISQTPKREDEEGGALTRLPPLSEENWRDQERFIGRNNRDRE